MSDSTLPVTNKAFSTILPKLQLAWDSTSLGAFKTCPRYYEYNIVQGFRKKSENVHLIFGSHLHSMLECYDRAKAEGASHKEATASAIELGFMLTFDSTLGRPWASDEPTKTRETLIRAVIWYLDKFEDDPMTTVTLANGKPAVEMSFRHEIDVRSDATGEDYMLCGHIDRLAHWQDQIWWIDRKTTKSAIYQDFFDRYSPDNQVSLYSFSGRIAFGIPVAGGVIDAIQVGVSFSRFQRGIIPRSKSQLDEWFVDTQYWLEQAERFAEANHYPMNEKSCSNYGGCPYRSVCGASPEVRSQLLKMQYSKQIWDPLSVRGD